MNESDLTIAINRLAEAVVHAGDAIAEAIKEHAKTPEERNHEKYSQKYTHHISELKDFNWASIGAKVLQRDQNGASRVIWNNRVYTRRTNNKFDKSEYGRVWFSGSSGKKDSEGKVIFDCLIGFIYYNSQPEPLQGNVVQAIIRGR
ncbi:MAG: hypothetical protein F6K55_03305 [Moorea sp. SIO4A3]|nr:hypothetical protein [Moorena sp. SIO4A3]